MTTAAQPPSEFAAAHGSPTLGEITPSAGSGMPLGVGGVFDLFHSVERTMNPKDVVMTPPRVAQMIVKHFKPSGRVLDPCRGNGAFWNAMPGAEWCEIADGRDFLSWQEPVDWLVSNPPYSTFWEFLAHSFRIAENIVYLIPLHKIWSGHRYLEAIMEYGGIRETLIIGTGTSIGFPVGLSVGAVHFKRGYKGETRIVLSSGGGGGSETSHRHSESGNDGTHPLRAGDAQSQH